MKLFLLVIVPLVSARVIRTQQQIPIIGDVAGDLGSEVVQSNAHEAEAFPPTIGVHFTTSYAVASARYQNGTIRDLVRVTGDAEYIDVMSRWTADWQHDFYADDVFRDSHYSSNHLSVPEQLMKRYRCSMRFIQRSTRRTLGLPSSRDTGILSVFMTKVRRAIEDRLKAPITNIAIALPRSAPHLEEDLQEALKVAGLTSARAKIEQVNTAVYQEANAAYAGLGYGRCWAGHEDCTDNPNWRDEALFLNFDNSSFSVGVMELHNAYHQEHAMITYGMDTKLGWWDLPVFDVPRAKFWAQVHEIITAVLKPFPRPVYKIVLLGDHGADEEFKEVVKAAVWDVHEFDLGLILSIVKKEDIVTRAARGAAELEWHLQEFGQRRNSQAASEFR